MNKITALGIDLAKTVFQLHGVDLTGKVVWRPSGKCVTSAAHSDDGLKVGRGELPPAPCF